MRLYSMLVPTHIAAESLAAVLSGYFGFRADTKTVQQVNKLNAVEVHSMRLYGVDLTHVVLRMAGPEKNDDVLRGALGKLGCDVVGSAPCAQLMAA